MDDKGFNVTSYFFDSIELLRTKGDIILHSAFVEASPDEEEYVSQFLAEEFAREAHLIPGAVPDFDAKAALWGAKTVFTAAQLLLLRNISELEIPKLLPLYEGEIDLSAMLSADLCLRFLGEIIERAEDIDVYDGLIPHLEDILHAWPYSAIGRRMKDPERIPENMECFHDKRLAILAVERIYRRAALHKTPEALREILKPWIKTEPDE